MFTLRFDGAYRPRWRGRISNAPRPASKESADACRRVVHRGRGSIAIDAISRRPDLELVGVWVHSPDKVGKDAGELAGTGPLGVVATHDAEVLIAPAPDAVVDAASGPDRDGAAVLGHQRDPVRRRRAAGPAELAGHPDDFAAARLLDVDAALAGHVAYVAQILGQLGVWLFTLRFDMRAPSWGAPPVALYGAVPEMCAWAEEHGGLAAVLCEHHGSEDGYLPSPMILAPAIAARTQRLAMNLILILPFYDPVRLAEDMAVLDLVSGGRASYTLALGYRPEEFEHFGLEISKRGRLADEKLGLLRRLLAGETVDDDGRRIAVTPTPLTVGGPSMMWGGGTLAAARRAGRYGLGMLGNANAPGMQEAYEEACRKHGHTPGPTMFPSRDTPSVVFVADDVDQAWQELGEHLLHDVQTYASWNPGDETTAGFSHVATVDELREAATSHVIISVPEAISRVRAGQVLNLSPLCGGLPPEVAWPYLKRVGDVVLPEALSERKTSS